MGHFDVTIAVGSPDKSRFVDVAVSVDTGATFTQLPRSVLAELRIAPHDKIELILGDGKIISRDVGDVPVRFQGHERYTTCVFGDEKDPPLLGVITLEQFLLAIDTVNGRLVPIEGLLW